MRESNTRVSYLTDDGCLLMLCRNFFSLNFVDPNQYGSLVLTISMYYEIMYLGRYMVQDDKNKPAHIGQKKGFYTCTTYQLIQTLFWWIQSWHCEVDLMVLDVDLSWLFLSCDNVLWLNLFQYSRAVCQSDTVIDSHCAS